MNMHSQELKISPLSDYYVYTPSTLAQKLFLYPISVGHFIYEPGYKLRRNHFDSFLIMYISKGVVEILSNDDIFYARTGDFVLLDCYALHGYKSSRSWEALWLHFDGPLARNYFQEISARFGLILNPANPKTLTHTLGRIYTTFRSSSPIIESVLSDNITSLLNSLLIPSPEKHSSFFHAQTIAESIAFINEHFREQISLEELSSRASLSLYHFTRLFAKETGFTPHQYLLHTRIAAAKFMLTSSKSSIKDIGFEIGFNSESSFCSTFKKWVGLTPSQYRENTTHPSFYP